MFCGRHLLAAKLRRANIDASAGAVEEIDRIVRQIRARWPRTRILLRADSGFARDGLMAWCEASRVDYVFGLARNARLEAEVKDELALAEAESRATGQPARRFKEFRWRTLDSWSRKRRVVAPAVADATARCATGSTALRSMAEWTNAGSNPRFIVTSLTAAEAEARRLYEAIYCARGEMENRIKECQLDQPARQAPAPSPQAPMSARHRRAADRTSAATMRANQLRLWLASMAYALLCALRRLGLRHTQLAEATCGTIRLRLLKIGALVRVSCRRVKLARDGFAVLPSGGSADGRWPRPSPARPSTPWRISA